MSDYKSSYEQDIVIGVLEAIDNDDLGSITDEDLAVTAEWAERNMQLIALDDAGHEHIVPTVGYKVVRAVQRYIQNEKRLRDNLRKHPENA